MSDAAAPGGAAAAGPTASDATGAGPMAGDAAAGGRVAPDRSATRGDFGYRHAVTTRWADNDVYGHVNNVVYYAWFDTAINAFLIAEGGLDIHAGDTIGLCVESHCAFKAAVAFPETIEVGLRVGKLGRSSVRYELAIFRAGIAEPAAEGWFVHVFVGREDRRPAPIPATLRTALATLERAA